MSRFEYIRVYADEVGESHFEDVSVPMDLVDYAPPAAPINVATLGPAASVGVIGSDAEWEGQAFHQAPARQFLIILEGTAAITTSDGDRRSGGPGMRFLLEDTVGRGHSSEFFENVTVMVVRLPD